MTHIEDTIHNARLDMKGLKKTMSMQKLHVYVFSYYENL